MKPFSSLFTKILLCFLLNLALVVVLLLGFFVFQTRVDLQSLIGRQASDRLRIAATVIAHDLKGVAVGQWPEILTRHKEIHQVDFALVASGGSVLASSGLSVPDQVITRIAAMRQRNAGTSSSQLFSRYNVPDKRFNSPREENPDNLPDRRHIWRGMRDPNAKHGTQHRLMMRTGNPTRYWTGTWIMVPQTPGEKPGPAMLLAASDSMSGNGFFFDPFPWIIAAAFVILLSALLWIPLVRHITKPLGRMTRAAEEIARGEFDVELSEKRRDEIGRLSGSINHMTSRLRGFVAGQKRFLRDVAHELGSPIARIQFGLGILEQHLDKKNLDRLADVTEDVDHMTNLVNELLSFSRAEMNPEKVKPVSVELLPIVERVARREGIVAERIIIDIAPDTRVLAQPALLSRAIANLVRNAVKYGGQAGPIHITARKEETSVSIDVRDSGPGVPEASMDNLFEPFFRPETSRDRDSGGVGLGLSIVKTCMETCGGSVSARNLDPRGFSVILFLPHST